MNREISKSAIIERMLDKKILFIGLDGASKRIMDRMIEQKELPVIERLITTGSYFHSPHSFKPCSSPVIWTSISTGKEPQKHGVKGFFDNTYSLKAKRIWEIFDGLRLPVGVMGHLLTWPPRKINDGFMIPSILALGKECYPEQYGFLWELTHDTENEKFISPQRMLKYFSDCYRSGIKLSTFIEVTLGFIKKRFSFMENLDRYSFVSSISMRTKFYRDLFIHLYQEFNPKYSYFHFHLVDTYSHRYWQYMEPELFDNIPEDDVRRYGQKINNAYRNADQIIKDILDVLDEDTIVVIASDHGFKGMEKGERWFEQLTLKAQRLVDLDTKGDIDISIIVPTIHVRVRNATQEKNDYYRMFLQNIEVLEDKKPLFTIDEIEPGDFLLELNREIDSIAGKHVEVDGKKVLAELLMMSVQEYTPGVHDEEDGILILNGPGVRKSGMREETVHVYDIIPTILALCNMPVGKDMDGKVITAGIESDFLHKYPVHYINSYEDFGESDKDDGKRDFSDEESRNLREQLKNLGYF